MDLSTVLGVALAWLFVGTAIYLGADGKAAALIDPTSFLVVLGGCIAATMAAFPFSDLKRLPKVLMKTVFWKSTDVQEIIDQALELHTISRKGGKKDVDEACKRPGVYPFLSECVEFAVNQNETSTVEAQLNCRLDAITIRHETGKSMVESMAKSAPAFGMIGTLIGLVFMMISMNPQDPNSFSSVGAGMAVALLTTLYGAMFANMICNPLADKLGRRSAEEQFCNTISMQAALMILEGASRQEISDRLFAWTTNQDLTKKAA